MSATSASSLPVTGHFTRTTSGSRSSPHALDEPPVEELPERGTHAVGTGCLLLDQVSQHLVGNLGAAMDGPGDLPWLAGQRVAADVRLHLPHPVPALALRATHERQRRQE